MDLPHSARQRVLFAAHGLVPASDVNDGQAAHAQADARGQKQSLVVRPAVNEGLDHLLQMVPSALSDKSRDVAHVSLLPDLR